MHKVSISIKKGAILDILKASLLSLVICLILALILSILIKLIGLSEKTIFPLVQIVKLLSVSGGIIIGFKEKFGGAWKGCVTGLLFSLTSIFVFLILGGKLSSSSFSFYEIASGVSIGMITGIVSVNLRQKNTPS
ncbi:MAG: TIGR04086 family membrane protein [Christensenellaceae bacterium]|jgi:putative membrane protein (TIGR04086 family)|nr:TIGR04086 family membrane protein [Christensenellaceae bacterium]